MVSVIQLFWVACNLCSLFILSMCTQQIYTIACIYISGNVEKKTVSFLRFLHSLCIFLYWLCNFHHLVHDISESALGEENRQIKNVCEAWTIAGSSWLYTSVYFDCFIVYDKW